MPKRTSDHGKHNRTPLLGGLKDSMNALAADLGLSKPKKHDTNPFGDALRETSERKGGIIDELTRHAVALSPVIKRRTFPELENVPEGLVLGWAQLPSTRGRGFSLGIFPDRDHFAQVAFADTHGRVFVGTDPNMDVQDMQARFMFGKEKEVTLPDGERLGESDEPRSRSGFSRAGHGLGSALHHAGRNLVGIQLGSIFQTHHLQDHIKAFPELLGRNLFYAHAIGHVFFHGKPRQSRWFLKHKGQVMLARICHFTINVDVAGGGFRKFGHAVEKGCLAASRRPDYANQLSALDGKVDLIQNGKIPIHFR